MNVIHEATIVCCLIFLKINKEVKIILELIGITIGAGAVGGAIGYLVRKMLLKTKLLLLKKPLFVSFRRRNRPVKLNAKKR